MCDGPDAYYEGEYSQHRGFLHSYAINPAERSFVSATRTSVFSSVLCVIPNIRIAMGYVFSRHRSAVMVSLNPGNITEKPDRDHIRLRDYFDRAYWVFRV